MLRAELFAVPDLVHGFTADPALSFSADPADPAYASLAAREGLPPGRFALARQVHGARAVRATAPGLLGEADALITDAIDLYLGVRVADCVPVLLLGGGREVAAVHSGWRGTAADIVGATVDAMRTRPRAAVIGPCICVDHYEVGEEVVDGILAAGVPAHAFVHRDRGPRPHVDLRAAIAWQLHRRGVTAVSTMPHCVMEDPRLHSHRRDRERSGRMLAFIGWKR